MSDLDRLTAMVLAKRAALVLFARQWLDAAAAEDVVQESLVALLAQTRPPADPVPWMFRVVRNAAIDQLRTSSRRRKWETDAAATRGDWFDPNQPAPLDGQAAEEALRLLPREQREIVVLRIWGGMKYAMIAHCLQMSTTLAYERYKSALAQMRIELEKSCRNKTD